MDVFMALHPEFNVVSLNEENEKMPTKKSESLRMNFVSGWTNRLWIDSDIEVLERLPLGDRPAIANEGGPHGSILWSGNNPNVFLGYDCIYGFARDCMRHGVDIDYWSPNGIFRHWATDRDGNKVPRNNLGYKPKDFL